MRLLLAGKLGAAIGVNRVRRVGLDIRLALRAVEDFVGADVDERGARVAAGEGDVAGAEAVDAIRQVGVVFAAAGVGESGGVDDDVGPRICDGAAGERFVGDVELRQVGAGDFVVRKGAHELLSELAAIAGDVDAHLRPRPAQRAERC